MSDTSNVILGKLHQQLTQTFNLEELKGLCFTLGIRFDDLAGDTLSGKVDSLIGYIQRRGTLSKLIEQLRDERPRVDWDAFQPAGLDAESPFKGLQYFTENDAHLFFGRRALTQELIAHLENNRFLAIVGASGSGKSSVVRAGVIPAIKAGDVKLQGKSSRNWLLYLMTPGNSPLKNLAACLTAKRGVSAALKLAEDLAKNTHSLDMLLRQRLTSGKHLLLIVDQFEELFTQCDVPEVRRLFVENLITAVTAGKQSRFSLILTLRADFYSHALQYPDLAPLLENQQKIVDMMNLEELRQAIVGPTEQHHWEFQPGLVDTILQDLGVTYGRSPEPGALPLLSHALLETWKRREGFTLTLAGYQVAGRVHKAIATTADAVYDDLSFEQRATARDIFLRLTELGEGTEDTRRRVALDEVFSQAVQTESVETVLEILAGKRLVTITERDVEVAHEALIREWPRLRQWLSEDRESLLIHRRLTEAALVWDRADRDRSYLYRGLRLAEAGEWATIRYQALNSLEDTFLRHSQQQRFRERSLRVGVTATAIVTLIVVALVLLIANRNLRASQAVSRSQFLASLAQLEEEDHPNRALLLAIESGRVAETSLAYTALYGHDLPHLARPLLSLTHEGWVRGAIWNGDESRILTFTAGPGVVGGTVRVWDVESGEELLHLQHELPVVGAAWNRDESRILSYSLDGTVRVWDTATGSELLHLAHSDSHGDYVLGAKWNKDESRILSYDYDGTIRVWDAASGTELLRMSHDDSVQGADWNEDESRILSYSNDGTARVWDAASGTELLRLVHHSWVKGAIWSKDESRILTYSGGGIQGVANYFNVIRSGRVSTVQVWNAVTGAELLHLTHDDWVNGAEWNKDESRILSFSQDGAIQVWDAVTGVELLRLQHELPVKGAIWNEDESKILSYTGDHPGAVRNLEESRILSYSGDRTVRVWDATSGEELLRLQHEDMVVVAMWNKDESRIFSSSQDGTARIWDATSGEELLRLQHEDLVQGAEWNKDENQILSFAQDGEVRVWDAYPGGELLRLQQEGSVLGMVWGEGERHILSYGVDVTVRVWDATSGEELLHLDHDSGVSYAAWNRDESRIISSSHDHTVRVWDAATGAELLRLQHDDDVQGAGWNKDESRILSYSGSDGNYTVRVWDAITGAELLQLLHNDLVQGASWNKDESRILSSCQDGTVRVWDATSGAELLRLQHGRSVLGAIWSQDGSRILSYGLDLTARVWDATTGEELLRLQHEHFVYGALWNGDESRILTYDSFLDDGEVRVWNATTGTELLRLIHDSTVQGAAWNKDESRIISYSDDGAVRMWDASSGDMILMTPSDFPITVAHWNQDEGLMLLATEAGKIKTYFTRMTDLLSLACSRAPRNFTWPEWQQYFPDQTYRPTCAHLPVHASVPRQ